MDGDTHSYNCSIRRNKLLPEPHISIVGVTFFDSLDFLPYFGDVAEYEALVGNPHFFLGQVGFVVTGENT